MADLNCTEEIQVLAAGYGYELPARSPTGQVICYGDAAGNVLCSACATDSMKDETCETVIWFRAAKPGWVCDDCSGEYSYG